MAVKITTKEYKRVDLIQVDGRIDSSTAPQLEQALTKIIDEGRYRIVVDLSETDFMSSAGLREIVTALKKAKRGAGDLRLAQPSDRVREVLEMAGLDTIFRIFSTQAEAVGSF